MLVNCIDDAGGGGADVAVIASCAVGASVCILIIAVSIFLIISSRRQATADSQRQRIFEDQMQRVWSVACMGVNATGTLGGRRSSAEDARIEAP